MSLPPPPLNPQPQQLGTLSYRSPVDERRRPGVLTAIGIISIVLGGYGALSGIMGSLGVLVMGAVTRSQTITGMVNASAARSRPTAPSANVASRGSQGTINEAAARMPTASRQIVVDAFDELTPLSESRTQMLHQLLAEAGEDVFPFAAATYTPQRIRESVSDSGSLASTEQGKQGNSYFVLAKGRIEVADDQAVFSPALRDAQSIRVYQGQAIGAAPAPPPAATPFAFPAIPIRVLVVAAISSLLNGLLAAFLLFAGIMVLRDSRRGRMMHLNYAGLRLVFALFSGFASAWMNQSMLAGRATASGYAYALSIGVSFIVAAIYPVALAIVFNLASVRTYYGTWREGRLGTSG